MYPVSCKDIEYDDGSGWHSLRIVQWRAPVLAMFGSASREYPRLVLFFFYFLLYPPSFFRFILHKNFIIRRTLHKLQQNVCVLLQRYRNKQVCMRK
jgi:hypothetical protein